MVDTYTQSERCHRHTKGHHGNGYVKLTAGQIMGDLIREKGYCHKDFCQSSINNVLNRLGYNLKRVRKVLPLKRIAKTGAIFENVYRHRRKKDPVSYPSPLM